MSRNIVQCWHLGTDAGHLFNENQEGILQWCKRTRRETGKIGMRKKFWRLFLTFALVSTSILGGPAVSYGQNNIILAGTLEGTDNNETPVVPFPGNPKPTAVPTATPVPTTTPLPTVIMSVSNKSRQKLVITWKKVKGAKGYELYRKTGKKGSYKKLKIIKSGSTLKYTNSKLKKGTTYYYKIRAYKYDAKGKKVYGGWSAVKGKTSR